MPFLIDGHNLIPKLGISLRNVDDEMQLVAHLQAFCRAERKRWKCTSTARPRDRWGRGSWDSSPRTSSDSGAPPTRPSAPASKTLGRAARNWTVVTSDRQVQADARAAGAVVISSDVFAGQVIELDARASPRGPRARRACRMQKWKTGSVSFVKNHTNSDKLSPHSNPVLMQSGVIRCILSARHLLSLFYWYWVSATDNGPHVPPMLSDGGVPPHQGYAAYRKICRIIFKCKVTSTQSHEVFFL